MPEQLFDRPADLAELYGRMLGQWTLEMNHVTAIVGGFDSEQKNIGQEGVIYTPVAKSRQAAAVAFLNENAFATPQWALDKEILRRIEPIDAISRVGNAQRSVLANLLSGPVRALGGAGGPLRRCGAGGGSVCEIHRSCAVAGNRDLFDGVRHLATRCCLVNAASGKAH